MRSTKARPARVTPLNDQDQERLSSPAERRAGCRPPGRACPGRLPQGAPSAARRGMASAVPQEASAARSAGHGAKASGIEARQGRDAAGGSMRSTKARPHSDAQGITKINLRSRNPTVTCQQPARHESTGGACHGLPKSAV